jgi:hypothetical protein
MRKILLASALATALAAGAPAIGFASVIFNVNQTIGAGGVTGTITTDGTLGALASANLMDWALTLNDGATTFLLTSANSEVGFILGSALSETASQLLFDTANGGIVLFQNPTLGSGKNFWCLDNPSGDCASRPGTESLRVNGPTQSAAWQGIVVIGAADGDVPPSAIRLPATLILLGLGFGALMLYSARRAEKQSDPIPVEVMEKAA